MTQLCLMVNSMPRDLTEFAFFLAVGFTAGSMGLIWLTKNIFKKQIIYIIFHIAQITRLKELIQQENQILISHLVQSIPQQLVSQRFFYHFY